MKDRWVLPTEIKKVWVVCAHIKDHLYNPPMRVFNTQEKAKEYIYKIHQLPTKGNCTMWWDYFEMEVE